MAGAGWGIRMEPQQFDDAIRAIELYSAGIADAVDEAQGTTLDAKNTAWPDATIVIPVHNKWVYTAACLRSLAETAGRASFEVPLPRRPPSGPRHPYRSGGHLWSSVPRLRIALHRRPPVPPRRDSAIPVGQK